MQGAYVSGCADHLLALPLYLPALCSYISLIKEEGLEELATVPTPALQAAVATTTPARCASAGEPNP